MIVALCLAVAYTGRASTLPNQGGTWPGQPALFQPSAFANPAGEAADTLVRPAAPGTLAATPQRLQIVRYTVQDGDTISSLADRFDVSENTILWANNLSPGDPLARGQQLTILPVSGVLYVAQAGDTLSTIAQKFESDAGSIAEFNQLGNGDTVPPGTRLLIPGGREPATSRPDLSARSRTRPTGSESSASTNPPPGLASGSANSPGSDGGASGTADRVPFRNRTASPKPLVPLTYYVVAGDTLSAIAQRFGVSPESIAAASGLDSQDSLSINQKLLIPPVPGAVHVVQEGDSLQAIADRYSVDPQEIARANGLKDPFLLQIGQTLVIPGGKVPEAVPTPGRAPQTTYTVTEGDSVSSIATNFGVDMRAIIQANGLSEPYLLQPGQQIVIPGATQPVMQRNPAPAPARPHTTYTVQQGDNLSEIAASFGIELNALVSANNLADPSSLQPGQQLVIPGAGRPSVQAAPTAAPTRAAPTPAPAPAPAPRPVVAKPAPPSPAPAASPGATGWNIVAVASRYLGFPYVWGGTSPSGFDCSGFVWYTYRRAGFSIPRDMWGQYQSGTRVSRGNLQPGDIVFFAGTYAAGLTHDGIYIGGGRFISAVDYGIGVAVRSLSDPYWSSRYFGATRPW